MDDVPENVIEDIRKQIDGQLVDRNRVIDHLLDLRIAGGDEGFTTLIDEYLADVPGRNVVEADWFLEALDRLAEAGAPQPA